jgi:hypothetical protein
MKAGPSSLKRIGERSPGEDRRPAAEDHADEEQDDRRQAGAGQGFFERRQRPCRAALRAIWNRR